VDPKILEVQAQNLEMPTKTTKPSLEYVTESLIQTLEAQINFPRFSDKELKKVQESMCIVEHNNHTSRLCSGTAPLARSALRLGFDCISINKFEEQTKNAQTITLKFIKDLKRKNEQESDENQKSREKKKKQMKKIPNGEEDTDVVVVVEESQPEQGNILEEEIVIPETQQQEEQVQLRKQTYVSCLLEISPDHLTAICDGCSGNCHSPDCVSNKEYEGKKYTFCNNCTLCDHCEETVKKDESSYWVEFKMTFCRAHPANGKNVPEKGWICGVCTRK